MDEMDLYEEYIYALSVEDAVSYVIVKATRNINSIELN